MRAVNRTRSRGRPVDRRGFTLVEALVIVAIAGILGTMAFTYGTETIRSAKASAAGSEVAFTLFRARQTAQTEHTIVFVVLSANDQDRIRTLTISRDDGTGTYEDGAEAVIQTIVPEQDIRLGDGRGNTTSLPLVAADTYAVAFGPRGDARNPNTGGPLTAFLNVSGLGAERGGWVKFSAIDITAAGGIRQQSHREAV